MKQLSLRIVCIISIGARYEGTFINMVHIHHIPFFFCYWLVQYSHIFRVCIYFLVYNKVVLHCYFGLVCSDLQTIYLVWRRGREGTRLGCHHLVTFHHNISWNKLCSADNQDDASTSSRVMKLSAFQKKALSHALSCKSLCHFSLE
jgi:hypothetical protein